MGEIKEMEINQGTPSSKKAFFNYPLMRRAMWFWFLDVGLSFFNFSVLMNHLYEPRWGSLITHQIGMGTRIVYVFLLVFLILRGIKEYIKRDLLILGLFWMASWLVIEWPGSLLMGRPVSEIVVGWNIVKGYMWPYVLVTYLTSPFIIGILLPHKNRD
jgi:hypothetical protein